jgi:trehalose synthase
VLDVPEHGRGLALRGKEHVRRHFLTPRLLRDWLVHFNELEGNGGGLVELAESLRTA